VGKGDNRMGMKTGEVMDAVPPELIQESHDAKKE
jgi:hypothetical protein